MKILLIMDPGILIPVKGYGGIERIIDLLAQQYIHQGHEVHLLVTSGSNVKGAVMHPFGVEGFPPQKSDARKAIPIAWRFLWKHRNDFDLIHSFGRLIYLLPILNHRVKKIMSYQREITQRNIKRILQLPNKNMFFTGCSQNLIDRANVPGNWKAVYNGVDFNFYQATENLPKTAPLMFLGRIEKIKGLHTAIAVAKSTNHQLIIAGNISKLPEEITYYENEIKPHIDGQQIVFVGEVNDEQKNEWLGKSKALLMPIEWNEPFGIVMIEAMACGTPVVGFKHGSVDEVIDEDVTGFRVNNSIEMIEKINEINSIDRSACRAKAKERFDVTVIAKEYLSI